MQSDAQDAILIDPAVILCLQTWRNIRGLEESSLALGRACSTLSAAQLEQLRQIVVNVTLDALPMALMLPRAQKTQGREVGGVALDGEQLARLNAWRAQQGDLANALRLPHSVWRSRLLNGLDSCFERWGLTQQRAPPIFDRGREAIEKVLGRDRPATAHASSDRRACIASHLEARFPDRSDP